MEVPWDLLLMELLCWQKYNLSLLHSYFGCLTNHFYILWQIMDTCHRYHCTIYHRRQTGRMTSRTIQVSYLDLAGVTLQISEWNFPLYFSQLARRYIRQPLWYIALTHRSTDLHQYPEAPNKSICSSPQTPHMSMPCYLFNIWKRSTRWFDMFMQCSWNVTNSELNVRANHCNIFPCSSFPFVFMSLRLAE